MLTSNFIARLMYKWFSKHISNGKFLIVCTMFLSLKITNISN